MPNKVRYEFFCNAGAHHDGCGYEFEKDLLMEDRCEPMDKPCPKCKKKGNICRKISPVANVDPVLVHGHKNMDKDFVKKVEKIKETYPNSGMKTDFL